MSRQECLLMSNDGMCRFYFRNCLNFFYFKSLSVAVFANEKLVADWLGMWFLETDSWVQIPTLPLSSCWCWVSHLTFLGPSFFHVKGGQEVPAEGPVKRIKWSEILRKVLWQQSSDRYFWFDFSSVVNTFITCRKFLSTISGVGLKGTSTAPSLWKDSA
jgi:hypothetical protein